MKEDLKNAIEIIKNECQSRDDCIGCPMSTKEEFMGSFFSRCSLTRGNPEDLEIEEMEGI